MNMLYHGAILLMTGSEKLKQMKSVKDQVYNQVLDQVYNQVWDQVLDQVRSQVWDQVLDQVKNEIR